MSEMRMDMDTEKKESKGMSEMQKQEMAGVKFGKQYYKADGKEYFMDADGKEYRVLRITEEYHEDKYDKPQSFHLDLGLGLGKEHWEKLE